MFDRYLPCCLKGTRKLWECAVVRIPLAVPGPELSCLGCRPVQSWRVVLPHSGMRVGWMGASGTLHGKPTLRGEGLLSYLGRRVG